MAERTLGFLIHSADHPSKSLNHVPVTAREVALMPELRVLKTVRDKHGCHQQGRWLVVDRVRYGTT